MKTPVLIHCENSPLWGGQEIRTFNECLWFSKKGYRIIVIAPKGSELLKRARQENWTTYALTFKRKFCILDILKSIYIFHKEKPNVIHTHGNYDGKLITVATLLSGKIKKLFRYRHVSNPINTSWHNKLLYKTLCRHIITTGDCITEQLIKNLKCSPAKVNTIGTGILPPENFLSKEEAHQKLCNELNLNTDTRFIGCIAVLRSWKGHSVLMDAFYKSCKNRKNYHLVIIGEGHADKHIYEKIDQYHLQNRVHVLGYRESVWNYFRAFDLHVLASQSNEGIPQTLLQAHFASTPIVGTPIGGIPEVIKDNEYGYLTHNTTADAISESISNAIDNPTERSKRSQKGNQFVLKNFHIDVMGHKIQELYKHYYLISS